MIIKSNFKMCCPYKASVAHPHSSCPLLALEEQVEDILLVLYSIDILYLFWKHASQIPNVAFKDLSVFLNDENDS